MKTWRYLWALFLVNKWSLTLELVVVALAFVAVEHAVGLTQREIFNKSDWRLRSVSGNLAAQRSPGWPRLR